MKGPAPAWSALEMAEAIIFDKRKILPVCVKLEGEYGVNGLFVGAPAIIGANSVEKVIELDLTDEEEAALAKSVAGAGKTCAEAVVAQQGVLVSAFLWAGLMTVAVTAGATERRVAGRGLRDPRMQGVCSRDIYQPAIL